MINTRGTKLLGIRHPIIQGGLQNWGLPQLAAAVSEAGGLGTINAATFPDLEAFRQAIRETKALTSAPFSVNISMLPDASVGDQIAGCIRICGEEGVKVIETAGRSPAELVPLVKEAGCIHIHKVPAVRHALSAQRAGVDAVTIVGLECAGHPGADEVGTLVLADKAVRSLDIPVFVGGGIADGRAMAAVLALGAAGVVMGTRFVATQECAIHPNYKAWMVQATERDTVLCQKSIKNMIRVANNATARECLKLEEEGAGLAELMPVISGARGRKAASEGDLDGGMFPVGPAVGLVEDIPTVEQLITRMVEEAAQAARYLSGLFS